VKKRQTKIAAIEPSGRLYGSEYCLLDILQLNNDRGYSWTIITTQGSFSDLLCRDKEDVGVLPILPEHLHLKSKWQKLFTYIRLLIHLARLRPDILYVNQAGILRVSHFIARILRIHVVCQVQTLEDAIGVLGPQNSYKRVLSFICNSRFIAEKTRVDANRKCILYQGVGHPNPRCSNSPKRFSSECLRLGILGRISRSKGHYLLGEFAKSLAESDCRFSIRVIGDGLTPNDTLNWEQYLKENDVRSFFDLRGYRTNLDEELKDVDLLLIPSIAEPLGRVLFDAANFGVPVVVSDGGGLGEIAALYKVGLPFKSGDPKSLVNAVLKFQKDHELETERFIKNSQAMLASLSIESYLLRIEHILTTARSGQACNTTWFGDNVPRA
jgi:glycosyltransferase involved in cell wall biosynthesis